MTKKNLRSYINYCSKSGCLLQSEGGSLPIATPLGRRIDRATVKTFAFHRMYARTCLLPQMPAISGIVEGKAEPGGARRRLRTRAVRRGRIPIISFRSTGRASRPVNSEAAAWTASARLSEGLSDVGMTFRGRAYTIVPVIRPGVMAAQRSLEPFVRVRILGAEPMRRAVDGDARGRQTTQVKARGRRRRNSQTAVKLGP